MLTISLSILLIGSGLVASLLSPMGEAIWEFIEFRISRAETGSGRFELFDFSVELITQSPIFGEGLNQARELLLPLRELKSTHNNLLEVTLEGGILGFILYLSLIFSLLRILFRKTCSVRDRSWMRSTCVGMFIFSNSNVTMYADSLILSLAIISTVASHSRGTKAGHEHRLQ